MTSTVAQFILLPRRSSMILSLTWLETAHLGFSWIFHHSFETLLHFRHDPKHPNHHLLLYMTLTSTTKISQATSSGCIPLSKWILMILMDDTPAPYRISSLRYGWHQILPLSGAHTSKLELRLVSWDVLQLGHFCNQPLLLLADVISWCGFVGGFLTFKS